MSYETILVEVADYVATVTLNRPERMNSFNHAMARDFRNLWAAVREDPAVRVIVLRAAPGRAFCSGMDVQEDWAKDRSYYDRMPFEAEDPGEWLGPKANKVFKPLVVAAHGIVADGAFHWLNEADLIICSEDATFFDPHVTFGLVASVEPVGLLARIPLAWIQRMTLMGNDERISAATALRINLVTEVTTWEALWPRAAELAAGIAAKHPVAIQGSVRAIWEGLSLPREVAVRNALKYTQIGNRIATADVKRSEQPKAKWRLV